MVIPRSAHTPLDFAEGPKTERSRTVKTKPSLPVLATATAVALSTMMAPQATAAATTSDFTTSYDIVSGNCTVNYSRNAQRNIMSGYKDKGRKLADVRGMSNTKTKRLLQHWL